MESAMQNSNPTILNAADLPTRLRPSSRKAGTYRGGILASALPSPADPTDFSISESEESDEDVDLMEEPIDEQEIYGKLTVGSKKGERIAWEPII